MYVEFKTLEFANILSYGNKKTKIDFEDGLNLLSGLNARGKSTITDALSFCLFGQPYRKIKMNELINNKNEKGLYTKVEFSINENDYIIERFLKPTKLHIWKNDERIDLLSTKKLTQSEIDKLIGVDYNLFRQIISLAINHNKPYLTLSKNDKRDIIESIFDIKIFADMLKNIKLDNKGSVIKSDMLSNTVDLLKTNINSLSSSIKNMTIAKNDFEKNKKEDLEKLENEKRKSLLELSNLKTQLKNIENEIENIELDDITENDKNKSNLQKEINESQYAVKLLKKDMLSFGKSTCSVCKSHLTDEYRESQIKKCNNSINKNEKIITKNEKEIIKINEILDSHSRLEKKKYDLQNKKTTLDNKEEFLQTYITKIDNDIDNVNKRKIDFNIQEMIDDRNLKGEDYQNANKENKEVLKEISLNETVIQILSDNGIKSYFYKKLIPLLNKKIGEYLSKLDLNLQLTFNEYLEDSIINISTSGNKVVNYYSLSEGEKKRIDMAILFSFIEITKTICNWNCNLIILDEILDSSIDESGLEKLIISIKSMMNMSKYKMSIYIISHRLLESDTFDNIYEIKKIGGFSQIEQIE